MKKYLSPELLQREHDDLPGGGLLVHQEELERLVGGAEHLQDVLGKLLLGGGGRRWRGRVIVVVRERVVGGGLVAAAPAAAAASFQVAEV